MWTQLFETGLGATGEAGVEWRPFAPLFFLKMSAPLIVIWAACAARRIHSREQLSMRSIALLILNLLFLALPIKSRRFVE